MFKVKVESELPKALETLKGVAPEKWGAILAYAANETAYAALNKYKKEMPRFFDNPTPFTINSMRVEKATRTRIEATVKWKDAASGGNSAGQYLQPEVYGGERRLKKFEAALQGAGLMPKGYRCVPTDEAPKDQYGNVPASIQNAILAYLKANPDTQEKKQAQKLKNMGFKKLMKGAIKTGLNYEAKQKAEARARAKKSKYFTAIEGNSTLPPGIYERVNLFGGAIRRLFAFVPTTNYRTQFPFEQIGAEVANAKFAEKLAEAIDKSVKGTTP